MDQDIKGGGGERENLGFTDIGSCCKVTPKFGYLEEGGQRAKWGFYRVRELQQGHT